MDSGLQVETGGESGSPGVRRRTSVTLAVAALVLAAFLLLQQRADAAQVAQIDIGAFIRSIVCPILNALASGPFGAFLGGLLGGLRAAFGCGAISG